MDVAELIAFIRAGNAEARRVAEAAMGYRQIRRHWRALDREYPPTRVVADYGEHSSSDVTGDVGLEVAAHIARWNPAIVLAQCGVIDAMVDDCVNAMEWAERPDCDKPEPCRLIAGVKLDGLRLLAASLRFLPDGTQHPDWREGWAVE